MLFRLDLEKGHVQVIGWNEVRDGWLIDAGRYQPILRGDIVILVTREMIGRSTRETVMSRFQKWDFLCAWSVCLAGNRQRSME